MGRTVTVELKANVADFIAPLKEADSATGKLDRSVEALDRDINKLPADALKAGAALDVMGAGSKRSADDTGKLDQRITELKTSTKNLADEFNRTGDPALLKKFRADSSELAGLTKMRKEFSGLAGDASKVISPLEKITQDAEKFSAEAEKAGMSLGDLGSPALIGGIAALAVPALALVGALTSVAASAGIAGAGIAGAIAGNPAVFKVEWGNAIGEIKKDWIDASQPFTGPTLAAIRSIGPLVASWHIDTMFAKAATFVEPLVHGIEGFVTGVEKGVAALVDKAGPEIKVLEADLPKLGDAVGTAFKMISNNAEGGAQTLNDFIVALEKTVIAIGAVISGAEAVGGALTSVNADVKHFLDAIPSWVYVIDPLLMIPRKLADVFTPEPFDATAGAAGRLGAALGGLASSSMAAQQNAENAGFAFLAEGGDLKALQANLDAAGNTLDKFVGTQVANALNTMMSLDRATLGFDASLLQIADSFKKNGKSLDEMTAKGNANVTAVLNGVQANIQSYQSNIAAGMGAEQAASAYDANTAALEKQLRKAGLAQSAIDGLIGKYRGVPARVDTDIVLNGLTKAIQDLNTTLRLINNIHDKNVTISVATIYSSQGHPNVGQGGTIPNKPGGAFAEGGDPQPGWAMVGERGPELVKFAGGEHVYTAGQTRSMMASGTLTRAAGSSVAVAVSLAATPGGNLTALGTLINGMIRDGLIVVKASQVRPA